MDLCVRYGILLLIIYFGEGGEYIFLDNFWTFIFKNRIHLFYVQMYISEMYVCVVFTLVSVVSEIFRRDCCLNSWTIIHSLSKRKHTKAARGQQELPSIRYMYGIWHVYDSFTGCLWIYSTPPLPRGLSKSCKTRGLRGFYIYFDIPKIEWPYI